jgi:molybdopterin-containing oxidoreductase family iron-sulfur binding subunit
MNSKETNQIVDNNMTTKSEMTLADARNQLVQLTGKRYWRSIDELSGTPEFEAAVAREFPDAASEWVDPVSRRGFMKLMGASLALAGMAGCTKQPDEPIFAYVKQPEDLVLGKSNYFATAAPFTTGAVPVLVKSDQFRPIKIDGNPEHPYNLGGSDPFTQATLLELYDPDRVQHVTHRDLKSSWADFELAIRSKAQSTGTGEGLYFLSTTITSPTLARQWADVQKAYPKAKLIQYDPATAGTFVEKGINTQFDLSAADVVLSLDADFLSGSAYPGFHRLLRDYAERRKNPEKLNRLYVLESATTTTGMKAEHRLGARASLVPVIAAAIAKAVGVTGIDAPGVTLTAEQQKFVDAVAKDLKASAGKSAVLPGLYQDSSVEAIAAAINNQLGNYGKTVFTSAETVNPLPTDQLADLKALAADLAAGKVDWLICLNTNPLYSTPADLNFSSLIYKVNTLVHLGQYLDETGSQAHWQIPAAHYLESWSDARAYDGTVSIIQPMIDPLYGGKSAHDVFQALLDSPMKSAYTAVRETWASTIKGDFEAGWRKALYSGWIEGTTFAKTAAYKAAPIKISAPASSDFEVIFRPDPTIYDGRFSNLGWMQELPKPVTNLSWDNAAIVSAATISALGVVEDDILELTVNGHKVKAPVIVAPGAPDKSVTVYLGYGRRFGRVAQGYGFDANAIRPAASPFTTSASVKHVEGKWGVAITKSHYQDKRGELFGQQGNGNNSLEADEALTRGIIRWASLAEFKKNPGFANEESEQGEHSKTDRDSTMFPNWEYKDNAWGMSIDMNSCTGCNACIVSCYAENNIAVVGKEQVRIGRNMQWLRIDTYFEGDLSAPRAHFQPMACQHCENAPCEQVCPVGATVHTPEGLNTMVYNRCVGTRYCSNNCPYKVRRFNFLLYTDQLYDDRSYESLKLMQNPDVTVRTRGVMEKCSYCVQRINEAKITSDKENRAIRDGEIATACQQACPANAITFGNLNDKASKVAKLHADERTYQVLADQNTRPRTTYVAPVLNLNEELEASPVEHKAKG